MNLTLGDEYADLRVRVRTFCEQSWPLAGAAAKATRADQEIIWRTRAIEAGFLHRTMPKRYGGGGYRADIIAETIIRQELTAAGTPHVGLPNGPGILAPALLECGTEQQRLDLIGPTLRGELNWCQGYSEPGAGSDLAAIRTRARLEGDEWVINGQKVWTSLAVHANMMFGLFRTEEGAAKHAGISFLYFAMDTRGVEVRPLKTMHGALEFCEVFFNDARIPAGNIVGARGGGWQVSKAVLKYERLMLTDSSHLRSQFDGLLDLARRTAMGPGRAIENSHVRQRLAEIEGHLESQAFSMARILTALARGRDHEVSAELAMGKLLSTNMQQMMAQLAFDLLDHVGLREPRGDALAMTVYMSDFSDARWAANYFQSLGATIGGGTSNIQRNIIGERVLGLPRDPPAPRDQGQPAPATATPMVSTRP